MTADAAKRELLFQKQLDESKAEGAKKQLQLQSEISSLKEQVASLTYTLEKSRAKELRGPTNRAEQDMFAGVTGNPNTNDRQEMGVNSAELQRDLEKVRSRYQAVKKQFEMAVALARKRKTESLNWVNYADSLELKIKKLEKKKTARSSGNPVTGEVAAKPSAVADVPAVELPVPEKLQPRQPIADGMADARKVAAHGLSRPSLSTSFMSTPSFSASFGPPGDEVTEDGKDVNGDAQLPLREALHAPTIEYDENTGNEAVLGSTQGDPSSDDGCEPQLPTVPASVREARDDVAIKKEPSSDGPEVVWERPAKRTRRDDQGEHMQPHTPQMNATIKRESSDSIWQGLGLPIPASQESLDLDEGQLAMLTPRKRQLVYHDMPSPEAPDTPTLDRNPMQSLVEAEKTPRPSLPAAVLTPVSVNVHRTAQDSGKESSKTVKHLKRGVNSLADDNEDGSMGGQMNPPSSAKSARLHSLLNSRPTQPSPILSVPRSAANTINDSPISGAFGQPPPVRTLPQRRDGTPASRYTKGVRTETGALSSATTTPKAREAGRRLTTPLTEALRAAAAEHASKKGGLRGRGIEQLKLDDFKVNPVWNDGETFAFNEVVRSRTDRGNLAGCTNPQCCGKAFRGMAESELSASGPSHMARPDSVAMMERYLGDSAFALASMPPVEKKELWLEAKTKQLADKYGKHRHRYHRRASPPGFWDADFPTTQEEELNRAESERAERAVVQERYREAMRQNGRWLFRDE